MEMAVGNYLCWKLLTEVVMLEHTSRQHSLFFGDA
jgi:hypothetical protein